MEIKEGVRVVALVGDPADNNPDDHGVVDRLVSPDDASVTWDDGHGSVVAVSCLRLEISPDQAGCWLVGHMGWHNTYRVIERAEAFGMVITDDDTALTDWYREHGGDGDNGPGLTLPGTGEMLDALSAWEAVAGQGGLSDQATDYLNGLAPVGYVLEWDMGELCMITVDEED